MADRTACTPACWAMPVCTVCRLTKPPRGRSVPLEAASGYCGYGCPGYLAEPRSGHLWPGEPADDAPPPAEGDGS